jgi:hypothetical protein
MQDWMVRAIKTFVQAFFGVLIPEICVILNGGFPESWSKLWAILAPVVAAALSAAICAVWNIILEALKEEKPAYLLGPEELDDDYRGRHE